jgi:hypothetical protein
MITYYAKCTREIKTRIATAKTAINKRRLLSRPSLLRLRMGGAKPLLPIYVFMAWTGKTIPLPEE